MISYLTSSSSLFYFFYGVSVTLYLIILFTSKKKTSFNDFVKPYPAAPTNQTTTGKDLKRFYLNVFFLDRKEVIRNIIRSKISRNRPLIRAVAKRAAIVLLEKGIVERIASSLCTVIPEKLELMGVTSTVQIVYTKAAYVCLEVTLVHLDLYKLLAFNSSPEKASNIMFLLDKYTLPIIVEQVNKFLLNFMFDRLMILFPGNIKEKLYNKMAAELEIIPCTEEEQGLFLIQTMSTLEANSQALPAHVVGEGAAEPSPPADSPSNQQRSNSVAHST